MRYLILSLLLLLITQVASSSPQEAVKSTHKKLVIIRLNYLDAQQVSTWLGGQNLNINIAPRPSTNPFPTGGGYGSWNQERK